ncbi:replication initiator protein A [Deinococcus hopiensis]|uniref:Plasmid replication initiator protein n=1 Tax=Deinococcus hopiensis KR-140 TaxID=695939 RepID=A0A1W1VE05_9DEIO|nr:replication initiator protein A [Deinococcus hopiensis]SMB91546.1 Plasmid replication initiator protein [Deinococcus hopiensis KR-140]
MQNPRISELDLARAGIVSASQAAPREKEWMAEFEANGVWYAVAGHAHRGRPYGLDGDILVALQTLFFRAGCPENNRLRVPPGVLIGMVGLSRSSKDYVRLREGVLRLASVRWEMTARWQGGGAKAESRTVSTGLISDLWLDDDAQLSDTVGVQVSPDSLIDVVFTTTFASLIRDGLYQILDGDLMMRLGSSPSRALYRCLAAHRIRGDQLAQEMRVNLRDWLLACGINGRMDTVLRGLDAAHERLIEEEYLSVVEDGGRGGSRTLTYRFRSAARPELVEQLQRRGVISSVAATPSADYPERILPAIHAVEHRIQQGWKPRSVPSAVVDAIKNPQKWDYSPQLQKPVVARLPRKPVTPRAAPAEVDVPIDPAQTLRALLRVKLNRPLSGAAAQALENLPPEGLPALIHALSVRPREEALAFTAVMLGTPL